MAFPVRKLFGTSEKRAPGTKYVLTRVIFVVDKWRPNDEVKDGFCGRIFYVIVSKSESRQKEVCPDRDDVNQ